MNLLPEHEEAGAEKNISIPNISPPKGGGAIKGIGETFQANSFSGAGSYAIPLGVPQARGMGPQLSLDYSSGGDNQVFGLGFSLNLPKVSRRTDKGIPTYSSADIYILSGEGELTPSLVERDGRLTPQHSVQIKDGARYDVFPYLPRRQGSFAAIEHWVCASTGASWWRLVSRDNITTTFGAAAASQVADPRDPTHIFEWLIDETLDAKGNKVLYQYKAEDGVNSAARPNGDLAQKYIHSIRYGNYFPDPSTADEKYAFEVIFDYGEYDLDHLDQAGSSPYTPVRAWSERQDPFSSYRSGFAIRTFRLCRHILVFHHFHELGDTPCLTQATRLLYDESPLLTLTRSVTQTGYRMNQDGSYAAQSLPPLTFGYSAFNPPTAPAFKPLTVDGSPDLPGYLSGSDLLPVDLHGEGLVGLLFNPSAAALYYEPLGDGAYQPPAASARFPTVNDGGHAGLSLQSLDGNGLLDLLVGAPAAPGYFAQNDDGDWSPYQTFAAAPTQLSSPYRQNVDLSGAGRADLLIMNAPDLDVCISAGKQGYSASKSVPLPAQFPCADAYGETEMVTFADMFGDGLMHRVRIRSGSVEVWPSLGYGRFGARICFANAPTFAADMPIRRLLLADVNGTGLQDLVVAYSNRVEVFLNQAGNAFSAAPHTIYLPARCDAADQLQFSDVLGQGTAALIFTQAGPSMRHWYYNFCGAAPDAAVDADLKPYLLINIANNLGGSTEIEYASSTRFYLEDKKNGRKWPTRLPFPVHVVEKIVVLDALSGSRFVSTRRYHDGYYDPVEKEFRGFGLVESWDSESYADYAKHAAPSGGAHYVPPVYTKTWHNTGAYFQQAAISKHYDKEYFQGDPQAYRFPANALDPALSGAPPETLRQAYTAMAGSVLRQELYAADASPLHDIPYTVSQSNITVRLCQACGDQPYAVFLVSPRESISYHYERNPLDPSVLQTFVLEIDPLSGKTVKECSVHLPRRVATSSFATYPEQHTVQATATCNTYINTADTQAFRYRGVVCQAQSFELLGLDSGGKPYFTFEDLTQVAAALEHPLPYQAAAMPGVLQARQLTWDKHFFWNADQSDCLPLGQIAVRSLPHHSASAVFTDDFLTGAIGPQLTDATLQKYGGYFFEPADGYWWNQGTVQIYATAAAEFYTHTATQTTRIDAASPLFAKISLEYDQPYRLFIVKAEQFIDEAAGIVNSVSSRIDYISLKTCQHTDINGVVSQALFDPLGQVIVSTEYGLENGQAVGGMRLDTGEYQPQDDASFTAVLANPEKYLQGASGYFYYNLSAWQDHRQPPCALSLVRDDFYHRGQQTTPFSCKTSINYSDGLGRSLESKIRTDAGLAVIRRAADVHAPALSKAPTDERWVVSGRTVYNNKGKPCEQYLPYFSDTPLFESQQEITEQGLVPPPTITHYDPLLRVIRIDTPKRFFSKTEFTPWQELHYDEDDTVIESDYYTRFMASYPAQPTPQQQDEKDALDKAARFYNTPAVSILDNAGRTIRVIQNNLGIIEPTLLQDIVQGTTVTPQALFDELIAQGYLYTSVTTPAGTWVAERFQPYTPGFVLTLSAPYQPFAERVGALLRQNRLTALHASDSQGREVLAIDPRLYYANQAQGQNHYNFKYRYAMGATTPLRIDSVDAGLARHLNTIFNTQFWSLSPRNYCQLICHDRLQRRSALWIKQLDNNLPITSYADFRQVESFIYGETQAQAQDNNLRGQLYQLHDSSGVLTNTQYSLQGQCLAASRQMTADYKAAIDWNSVPPPALEPEIYTSLCAYDAIGQLLTQTTPDGSITRNGYNLLGLLCRIDVTHPDQSVTPVISAIEYDAKGQRTRVAHGNGIVTDFAYEPTTLYLTGLISTRPAGGGSAASAVQDIRYVYDPVGNITRSRNHSSATLFNHNQQVDPLSDYTYDALYRLRRANGRQHPGINAGTYKNNAADQEFKQCLFNLLPDLNDADKLENYSETYAYDDAGNLIDKQHSAPSATWRKQTAVTPDSNRLAGLVYDASGNLRQLDINNAVNLSFNCCEHLVKAAIIERPGELDDCDYYVYDSGGRRSRKVGERMAGGGAVTLIEDSITIGNYVITRHKSVAADGAQKIVMERQTLRCMDRAACAAIMHGWVIGAQAGTRQLRFQLGDNLGSIAGEYDGDARLISYEEYFPYGGTAIIAGPNQAEVKLKNYRYCGQERDDSTGLYYYGARYYAPWLGRWLNPDPAGTIDGFNLYAFVGGNPITHVDRGGMALTNPLDLANPVAPAMGIAHPIFGGAANAGAVHFGMNAFGPGNENNIGFYGYRDAFVVAGAGITAETSWRHIFGENRQALNNASRPPSWIKKALGAVTVAGAGLGGKALAGFGVGAAIAGALGGAVVGIAAVATAAMWWSGRKAQTAAATAPVGGANTIGQVVPGGFFGPAEDYTNRRIAPADVGLYRHVVGAFSGNKNVVSLATAPQVDTVRLGIRYSKAALDYVFANQATGASIHFHLDGLVNAPALPGGAPDFSPSYKGSAVLNGAGNLVSDTVTAHELRYLARRFHRNVAAGNGAANPPITFYLGGVAQPGLVLPHHQAAFGSRA